VREFCGTHALLCGNSRESHSFLLKKNSKAALWFAIPLIRHSCTHLQQAEEGVLYLFPEGRWPQRVEASITQARRKGSDVAPNTCRMYVFALSPCFSLPLSLSLSLSLSRMLSFLLDLSHMPHKDSSHSQFQENPMSASIR
jgi:hypothetical protein